MGRVEKTVFISYRHTNVGWALAISQNLTIRGFDVFLDYKSLNSGDFEQTITENIKARAHFLILLAPSALKGCERPKDWVRREIELALENKRNIVPIMLESFDFGAPETLKYLTGKLEQLKHYQGLNLPADYFEEGMQRLCNRFLNIPLEAVIHPVSDHVERIVEEQKREVAKEAKVEERVLSASEWFERGYASKEPEEKIRYYTKAIELDPKDAYAYNNRANSYAALGQDERAIEDYDRAIQLNPEDAAAYSNRGNSYAALGLHERAIEDYNQAIQLNPELPEAYSNRGNSYAALGQHERAIEDLDQVIQLNPEFAEAYYNRGNSYAALRQHERAIQDYDRAFQLNPEDAAAYYNKACCYALQGIVIEAVYWLRQALTKDVDQYCKFVKQDSDFDRIRGEEKFQKLLEEFCIGNK